MSIIWPSRSSLPIVTISQFITVFYNLFAVDLTTFHSAIQVEVGEEIFLTKKGAGFKTNLNNLKGSIILDYPF